ncbi:MAG: hypothetical protein MJA27_14425 [Pseudanabaenales cyanobacterium]|nr:hypothetical protein [Pseudanabaenales cyanobacterium]
MSTSSTPVPRVGTEVASINHDAYGVRHNHAAIQPSPSSIYPNLAHPTPSRRFPSWVTVV